MVRCTRLGFTIIELLVALSIVGILTGVALPSYIDYVQRSRVPVALDALSSYATRMEQRFQDTGSYASDGSCAASLPTRHRRACRTRRFWSPTPRSSRAS